LFKVHVFQFRRQFGLIEWRAKVSKSKSEYQAFFAGFALKTTEINEKWPKIPGF